ncbi:5'-nucleotidase C-terminal domain-containing protein [Psychroflexus sp. CAK8W]|uniref:5'-nucleotidase C-terminal domain-containing protein n=1 Tax=Psychroflexus longus TaxID=2873596 RepID=A0ABS7XI53_9FLAO|nr:5'-nucleotidase [Psychroflexus longus]MBZ9778099.1 5'-nucleotidase C-terminal domain-containing protein [Psychroflexus longus]
MNKISILFLAFSLWACSENPKTLSKIEGQQVQISDSIAKNKDLEDFITPYREHITEEMEGVLAYTPEAMYKSDAKFNTPIGNMMADAVMEMANPVFEKRTGNTIDAVILNYGGIRSGINAGDISTRTAYNIMPFENEVAVAALSSEELRALINYLAKNKTAHPIAGLQVILNAEGELLEAKMNGEQIQNKTYYVATSDYLIKGGDRMDFFLNAENVETLDYKLRNLFIDYFKKKDTIAPVRDKRFIQLQN